MTAAQGEGAAPDVLRLYSHFGAFNLKTEDVIAFPSGLPGFEAAQRYGLIAPAGLPPAITAKLSAALREALSQRSDGRLQLDPGEAQ